MDDVIFGLLAIAAGALFAFAATSRSGVLSALGGGSAITAGVMLLVGTLDTSEFDDAATTRANDWWWYVLYLALAVAGVIAQARAAERLRGSMRDSWAERSARSAV